LAAHAYGKNDDIIVVNSEAIISSRCSMHGAFISMRVVRRWRRAEMEVGTFNASQDAGACQRAVAYNAMIE